MIRIRTVLYICMGWLISWSTGCLPDKAATEHARRMEALLDSLESQTDIAPAPTRNQLTTLLEQKALEGLPSAEIRAWELVATASKYMMDSTNSLVAAEEAVALADKHKIPEQIARQYINQAIIYCHAGDIAVPTLQENMKTWLQEAEKHISTLKDMDPVGLSKLQAMYYLATSQMFQLNTGEDSRGKDANEIKQNLDKALEFARLSGDPETLFLVLGNQLYLTDYYSQDSILSQILALDRLEPDEVQQQQLIRLCLYEDPPEAEMESIIGQARETGRFDIMLNGIGMLIDVKQSKEKYDEAEKYISLLLADSIVNKYPGIKMRVHKRAIEMYEEKYSENAGYSWYRDSVFVHKSACYDLEHQQSSNRDQTYKGLIDKINLDRNRLAAERARTNQILAGTVIVALIAILVAILIYQRSRINRQQSTRVLIDTIQQGLDEARDKQIEAEEATRTEIGRELHDSVKANIAAAKMAAEGIYNSLSATQDQTQQSRYTLLIRALNSAQEETRNLSHRLMHAQVADLKSDIENWCQMLRESAGFKAVNCSVTGLEEGQPEAATRLHILRIIQSLTQNIIYHAYASTVTLQLMRDRDMLRLVVEDDGRGFDPQDARAQSKGGMKIIEARVNQMGGSLQIDSKEGQGTTVSVQVPFRGVEHLTSSPLL